MNFKVLEAIEKGIDWKKVGQYVFEHHPDVFEKAILMMDKSTSQDRVVPAKLDLICELLHGNTTIIPAVKEFRVATNAGLKVSKELVEIIRDNGCCIPVNLFKVLELIKEGRRSEASLMYYGYYGYKHSDKQDAAEVFNALYMLSKNESQIF